MERDFTVIFRIRPTLFPPSPTSPPPAPLITTSDNHTKLTLLEPRSTLHNSTTYKHHTFSADRCYASASSTLELFKAHVEVLIPFVLDGGYATVLAYGQTGSGKTHTLSECSHLASASLFGANRDVCRVYVEAIEIYAKNRVNDLFDGANRRVVVGEGISGGSMFANATRVEVGGVDELRERVEEAWVGRVTRGTEKNLSSSRSHAIIRISCQPKHDANAIAGVLQIVDLAGSERAADHSSSSVKDAVRMAETVAINTSLMTLKNCIRSRTQPTPATQTSTPHIPFRSSKLTLSLKEAFDLYSRQPTHTLFIATVSPDAIDTSATLNTLRYASALVSSPHTRIALQPDALGRNVFFWSCERVSHWLLKYGCGIVTPDTVDEVVRGEDGMRFSKLPEREFLVRVQSTMCAFGTKQEVETRELYLKWWKLVIASRTLSQRALEEEWRQRQAKKVQQEEDEMRADAEVQRLLGV